MIETTTRLTKADIAHTNANLDLLAEFVQEFLELPDDAELVPDNANVVFMPPQDRNDPGLIEANLRIARKLVAEGKTVVIWTIGSGKGMSLQEYEASLAIGSSRG